MRAAAGKGCRNGLRRTGQHTVAIGHSPLRLSAGGRFLHLRQAASGRKPAKVHEPMPIASLPTGRAPRRKAHWRQCCQFKGYRAPSWCQLMSEPAMAGSDTRPCLKAQPSMPPLPMHPTSRLTLALLAPATAVRRHAGLHVAVRCGADECQALEQLCLYITRPALADERVQTNAAGQVVLKLKTA